MKEVKKSNNAIKQILRYKYLYLMLVPVLINFILWHYWPMYGAQIAFRHFSAVRGITGSEWVGLQNFQNFFDSIFFWQILRNTLYLSIMSIVITWPMPIIFALLLNEVPFTGYKRVMQTMSYLPFFVSVVVVAGITRMILSPDTGIINDIIRFFGGQGIHFLAIPEHFVWIYLGMITWRWLGYDAIIYLAAITSIDMEQYEAAHVDGASRLQRLWYITLPGMSMTIVILFILRLGGIMNIQWMEILLLQNSLNQSASEVIQTFVYRRGLVMMDYSFATAAGLFQSVIGFVFLIVANQISKKVSDISLF